jgi:tetratricopeptide (TPR) repeat protein
VDIAGRSADALDRAVGERMIGFSLHFLGEHAEARRHITRMLAIVPSQRARTHVFRFQFDLWSTARATLAESLWIQGLADEARDQARMATGEAKVIGHAVTICNTLAKTSAVALHAGDLELAGEMIADLLATANAHALMFWRSEGGCLEGVRLLRSGNLDGGLSRLRAELRGFPGNTLTVRYIGFLGELADALSQAGSHADARAAVDEALERCNRNSENWCIAELLRIQGEIVRRADGPHSANEAERCFLQSLEWAHRQGALAWELRSATSLARLRMDQGLPTEAIALLENARSRFRNGGNSADVLLADRLIVEFAGA